MNYILRITYILLGFSLWALPVAAQFSTCDSNLVNAHLNPAGYKRLWVPTQPCSMYYYSTTTKIGIDAHRDAYNLNVPQLIMDNLQENSDVSAALYAQGVYSIAGTGSSVWLGITDSATLYNWRVMATGAPATFFNWSAGDPNNLPPSCKIGGSCAFCGGADAYWCQYGEDCAIINASGKWLDNTCKGSSNAHVNVLELNTCPVLTRPRDTTICQGNAVNLSTTVVSGGTAPYTYTWNPGGLTGPTVSVSPATATTYTVEASDHYLCKADTTFTITVNSVTTPVIIVAQPVTYIGQTCVPGTDHISLSIVSSTATYSWSFGAGSSIVSGSAGGPYDIRWSSIGVKAISVTVTDGGCTTTATGSVTVDSVSSYFTVSPAATCVGQNVTITVGRPLASLAYNWSFDGGSVVSGTTSGPYTVNWSTPGTKLVSLTVTGNGCTATSSVNVTINAPPSAAFTLSPDPACVGSNVTATITTPSPTGIYTWAFGGANVVSGTTSGPYTLTWPTTGLKTVNVTVTDNGCQSTSSSTVTISAGPNPAFTVSPASTCIGQNVTATVTTVSPTAIYSWGFSGANIVSGTTSGPYTLNWSTAGTKAISVTVTDNGCSATSSVSVNITAAPTPAFTLSPATSACIGNPVSATLTGAASGTAAYAWGFDGGTVISGSGAGPYSISWSTPGTKNITLTVTDGGCSGTAATQSVSITASPTADAGADIQICPGTPGTIGTAAISGYTYSWSPAAGLSSTTVSDPTVVLSNTTGATTHTTYTLVVTSGTCTATDAVDVAIYPEPNSSFNVSSTSTCTGSDITVTYAGTVSGTATYAWNFNGGNVTTGTTSGPYTVNWSTAGTYAIDLTVTENGCPSTSSNNVTVSNSLSPAFTLSPSATACPGEVVTVTLTGTPSGTASYNWSFNNATVLSGSVAGPYTVTWSSPGLQAIGLTVTDGACSGTASQSITIVSSAIADAGADIQLCPGAAGSLGSPSTAGYTYSWSPAWGLSSTTVSDPSITIPSNPTGADIDTFYVLTVSSGSCTSADTVRVTIYPDINNNFTVSSSTACTGSSVTITYSGTPSPTATYTWNFAGAAIASGSGAGPYVISWPSAGLYNVTLDVTDHGCPSSTQGTQSVAVSQKPMATAGTDQTVCSGVSVQLGSAAVAGVTYSWTPAVHLSSATISDPTFSEINTSTTPDANTYTLIADGSGCRDTAHVVITVSPSTPIGIVVAGSTSFCQGGSVVLDASSASFVDYSWTGGATTSSITVATSGIYSVSAHDAGGCLFTGDPGVTVTVNPTPVVSLAANGEADESCTGANDGSLTVSATAGTAAYSYLWNTSPPQATATAANLSPGTYRVTVTDNNGCVDSNSFTVRPAPFIGVNIDSITPLTCNGKNDAAIYASVTGGNQPVNYIWSTGATTPAITALGADTFSVSVTDARGCTVDTSVIITQPGQLSIVPVSPLHIAYGGSEQIELSITPASSNYSYSWAPGASLSCTICPGPVASPLITTTYTLTVTDLTLGCTTIDTLTLYVDASKNIYIPNAFTPNGDGVNDTYLIFASGPVKFFDIEIFDRWGEKVYESNDMGKGWDGTYHGVFVSNGDYVYQVSITFLDNETQRSKGSVTLIR